MTSSPAVSAAKQIRRTILVCFFASGACGLIYQIAWLRVMGLVFGSTTLATCTVLAGYMAGLGFGALYFGKKSEHLEQPVKLYGLLEFGVGLYAFATPFLWKLMQWICVGFYRWAEPDFWTFSLFRFILAFFFLLLPTFLMGGTLPVIIQQFVKSRGDTAQTVGRLYALNTAGAVLGVYLAGFYLLWVLGVWQTTLLTGALNILIYIVCRRLPQNKTDKANASVFAEQNKTTPLNKLTLFLLTLFGISGAVSMMYEVGWTRVLAMSLGSSIYAFSTMLATFLLGITLGSWFFSLFAKRYPVTLTAFAFLEILTAILVLIGLNQFDNLPFQFVQTFGWAKGSVVLLDFGRFLLCSWVMLPPTFCIGALFACFIHIYRHTAHIGADVGRAYFSNTIGTILGSVLTGFVLVPYLGIQNTLILGAWLNAGVGFLALALSLKNNFNQKKLIPGLIAFALVAVSAYAVTPWNQTLLSSDTVIHPEHGVGMNKNDFLKSMRERETLFYKEGASATVTVTRVRDNLSLAVNGKTDASTSDMFTQFFLGHLPFFAKPDAQNVLVIGLGSASTLAAVASHPVKSIDAVELEKEVITGAGFFHKLNRDVLKDPRVRMHHNDGRNFLLMRPDKYDVIISEPSNPWMAGVANLFALEHYQTMRKRLNDGGVVCQWLHAYSMSSQDLQMIINTFARVFPHTTLWTSYYPDLMLLGSEKPLIFDENKVREVFARPHVAEDFKPAGIDSAEGFFSTFWLNDEEVRRLSTGGKTNSDNAPLLEFSAPHFLYQQTLIPNLLFLNGFSAPSLPEIKNLNPPIEKNATFFRELAKGYLAKKFTSKAESAMARAEIIEPESPANLLILAELAIAEQMPDRAKEILTSLLLRDPKTAQAHFLIGQLAHAAREQDTAYMHLQIALRLQMDNREYLKEYFKVVCETGHDHEAIQLFEKIKELELDEFDLWAAYAALIFQKAPRAIQAKVATDLIEKYPRFPAGYLHLGELFENAHALPQAMAVFEKMTQAMPLEGLGYYGIGLVYSKMERKEQAEKYFKKAFKIDPSLKQRLAA